MAEVLGAVGSVVGIAGFGLQLAHFLNKYLGTYKSAPNILILVLERIEATNEALEEISELLQLEEENVKGGGKAQFFSLKALRHVRKTSDKCLTTFWRIEAVIVQDKATEEEIALKLQRFHVQLGEAKGPVLLQLDRGLKLGKIDKWKWSFSINDKLRDFELQLDRHYSALMLMLQVITLGVNLTRPNIDASLKIHYLVEQIPQTAQHSGIPQVRPRRKSSYMYPTQTSYPLRYNEDPVPPSRYQSQFSPSRLPPHRAQPVNLYEVPAGYTKPRSRSTSRGRSAKVAPVMQAARRQSTSAEAVPPGRPHTMRHLHGKTPSQVNMYDGAPYVASSHRSLASMRTDSGRRSSLADAYPKSTGDTVRQSGTRGKAFGADEEFLTESPTRLSLDEQRSVTTEQLRPSAVPRAETVVTPSTKRSVVYQRPSVNEQLASDVDNAGPRNKASWPVNNMVDVKAADEEVNEVLDTELVQSTFSDPNTTMFSVNSTSNSVWDGCSTVITLVHPTTGATTPRSLVDNDLDPIRKGQSESSIVRPGALGRDVADDSLSLSGEAMGRDHHAEPQQAVESMALILHPDHHSQFESRPSSPQDLSAQLHAPDSGTTHDQSLRSDYDREYFESSVNTDLPGPRADRNTASRKGKQRIQNEATYEKLTGNDAVREDNHNSSSLSHSAAILGQPKEEPITTSRSGAIERGSSSQAYTAETQQQKQNSTHGNNNGVSSTHNGVHSDHDHRSHGQNNKYQDYKPQRRASPRRSPGWPIHVLGTKSRDKRSPSSAHTSSTTNTIPQDQTRTRILTAIMKNKRTRARPDYADPCLAYLIDNGSYTQIPTDMNAPHKKILSKTDNTDELCKKYCRLSKQNAAAVEEILGLNRLGIDWTLKSIQSGRKNRLSVASRDRVLIVVITADRARIPSAESLTDLYEGISSANQSQPLAGNSSNVDEIIQLQNTRSQVTKTRPLRYTAYTVTILDANIPAPNGGRHESICQKEHFSQATIETRVMTLNRDYSVLESKLSLSLPEAIEVDKVIERVQRDEPREGLIWTLAQLEIDTSHARHSYARIAIYLKEYSLDDADDASEDIVTRSRRPSPLRGIIDGRQGKTDARPRVTFRNVSPPDSRKPYLQAYDATERVNRDTQTRNTRNDSSSPVPVRRSMRERSTRDSVFEQPESNRDMREKDRASTVHHYNDNRRRDTYDDESIYRKDAAIGSRIAEDRGNFAQRKSMHIINHRTPYRSPPSVAPHLPSVINSHIYSDRDDEEDYAYPSARLASRARSAYSQVPNLDPGLPMRRDDNYYPDYYDTKPFNTQAVVPDEGAEIVQKLLKNWTPAGAEEKEKKRKEKTGDVQDDDGRAGRDMSDDSLDSDIDDDYDWDPYGGARLDATRPGTARSSSFYGSLRTAPTYVPPVDYYRHERARQHSLATDYAATSARERAMREMEELNLERRRETGVR